MLGAYPAPLPHLGSLLGVDITAGGTLGALTLAASATAGGAVASAGDPAPLPSLGLGLYNSGACIGQLYRSLGALTCVANANIPLDERPAFDFWDEPAEAAQYCHATQIDWRSDVELRADVGGSVAAAAVTLGALGRACAGTVEVAGGTAKTLGLLAVTSAGAVTVQTTTVRTLGALTVSGLGGVSSSYVASAFCTLASLTAASGGNVTVTGDTAGTLGAIHIGAAGGVSGGDFLASVNRTLGTLTLATTGGPAVAGTGAATFGALATASSGSVLSGFVAAVNQWLGALSSQATAQALIYELGVRRRHRAHGHERRIGERVVRARETEIEGKTIT